MKYKTKILKSGHQIQIQDDMTINESCNYKDLLLNTLKKTDHLIIHFKPSVNIDISCMQLLCASYIYGIKQNKKVEIAGETPQAIKSILQATGLKSCDMCTKDYNTVCMWQNGGY